MLVARAPGTTKTDAGPPKILMQLSDGHHKSVAKTHLHACIFYIFQIRTTKNLNGQPELEPGCPWDNHFFCLIRTLVIKP